MDIMNKEKIVISDTTAITYLSKIGALHLLESLFKIIYIPQAVFEELTRQGDKIPGSIEVKSFPWIKTEKVKSVSKIIACFDKPLDPGETEAIALAIELNAALLIIDEKDGRIEATAQGIAITGMLGILLKAKEKGLIPVIRPYLDKLMTSNFKLNPKLYRTVLISAGEASNSQSA